MKQGKLVQKGLWVKFSLFLFLIMGMALKPDGLLAQTPGISGLSLNSASGNNTNDDDLDAAYTLTGSAVTAATAWYKSAVPIMTLYAPFEGGTTNALMDFSGNSRIMTIVGAPTWHATGGRDGFGTYSFSGTDYINAGKIFPTKSSYTQTAWIYRTVTNTYNFIIGGQSASPGHGLRVTYDQRLSAGQNGDMKIVQGWSGSIASSRWIFAAVTFDYSTGSMVLYQDGQPIDTAIVPSNLRDIIDSTVQIGATGGGTDWRGSLDDIRIYNYALSGDQIKALFALHGADKIAAAETMVGDTWLAQVTPFSSSAAGTTTASNSITIIPTVPVFTSAPITTGIAGKLYTYIAHATGGPTPVYQLSLNPAGMTIDSITGIVRWYPGASGSYNITVAAVNTTGSATQNYTVNIADSTVAINNQVLNIISGDSLACSYNLALQATTAATAWYKNGTPLMTLYMPFEGGSTFALDDASGNNITALPMGNPVWTSNGGHDGNGCYTFDGSSYLIAGNIFPTKSSYTKTAWIYRTTTSEYNHILSGWDHNNLTTGGHGLRVTADQRLSAGQNGDWRIVQTPAGTIVSNRWYFVAVTYNYSTGEMDLYLDGILVNSAIAPSNERDVTDPSVLVGATQGAFAWKGKIDDARIYNFPLTPPQIATLFTANGANRIVPQETQLGEIWQARVTPYSATEAGTPWATNDVIIGNPNRPPVLAAIGAKSVSEGQNLNFNISASDPDGTIPILATSTLPANATFTDNGNGTGTFNFNPDYFQAGSYNISFIASDGSLADSEIVDITVLNTNRPPVLAAISAKTDTLGNTVTFLVIASDPDNEIATLTAANLPLNAGFTDNANNTGSFTFTPSPSQSGTFNIQFLATDPFSATDSETVFITVVDTSGPANWIATINVTGETAGNAIVTASAVIGMGDENAVSYAAPMPPEYTASIQLWHSGYDGPYSKDIQKKGDNCYFWTIEVDPHGNASPPTPARCATISWNPTELSPDRHYVLHEGLDPSGPVVVADMRTTSSYQVCDIQTLHYYTIHWEDDSCAGTVFADIALNAGWNLVSIPVQPKDSSLLALFPSAQIAYGYNDQYFEVNKLLPGQAYWIKVPTATAVTFTGQPITGITATLTPGWHLSGAANCTATPLTNPSGLITAAYGFNGAYQAATQFASGQGYWVNVSSTCDLTVTCGILKEYAFGVPDSRAKLITLHAQGADLGGVSNSDIVLGVGSGEQTFPAPPDAPQYSVKMELYRAGWKGPYFEDIRSEDIDKESWIVALNTRGNMPSQSTQEIRLSWNTDQMGNDIYQLRTGSDEGGTILVEDMHSVNEYNLKALDGVQYFTVVRKSGSDLLPGNFVLEQNYPNPFNPTTTIEYSLPRSAEVHLAIFNTLGRKVKEIVNGTQAAGNYRVIWDGTDGSGSQVSTGIYLYRMRAGDFVSSKKMLLMK